MTEREKKPPVSRKKMEQLRYKLGSDAVVVYVQGGREIETTGQIDQVNIFSNVILKDGTAGGGISLPFMGSDTAIKRVEAPRGTTVFTNPAIDESYDCLTSDDMHAARKTAFGNSIATSLQPQKDV